MSNKETELHPLEGFYLLDGVSVVTVTGEEAQVASTPGQKFSISRRDGGYTIGEWKLEDDPSAQTLHWCHDDGSAVIEWTRISPMQAVSFLSSQLDHGTVKRETLDEPGMFKPNTTLSPRRNFRPRMGNTGEVIQKLKLLNSIRFPTLTDADFVQHHLDTIERLAENADICHGGIVDPGVEGAFVVKVVESLNKATRSYAEEITRLDGDSWPRLRQALIRRFTRRDVLSASLQRRIAALHLSDLSAVEDFITQSTSIVRLSQQITADDPSERRAIIRLIVAKLPQVIRVETIRRLYEATSGRCDWESALPFDAVGNELTVVAIIRNLAAAETTARTLHQQAGRLQLAVPIGMTVATHPDRVHQVDDVEMDQDMVNHVHEQTAEEFARTFKSAFVAFPAKGKSVDDCSKALEAAGFTVRHHLSSRQRPYFIIGTHVEPAVAEARLQGTQKVGVQYRPFRFKDSKNSV